MSDKQIVFETLQRLPESASLEEIQDELAILAAIRRGRAAVAAQQVVDHEEVRRRSTAWIMPSSGPTQP